MIGMCVAVDGVCLYCQVSLGDKEIRRCYKNPKQPPVYENQKPCSHLGLAIERDGVTIKVKCSCNGKEQEQLHTAHECHLYKRCLPTLIPSDIDAWKERLPESEIYHLCYGCDRGADI